jgi:hypothetical protein
VKQVLAVAIHSVGWVVLADSLPRVTPVVSQLLERQAMLLIPPVLLLAQRRHKEWRHLPRCSALLLVQAAHHLEVEVSILQ